MFSSRRVVELVPDPSRWSDLARLSYDLSAAAGMSVTAPNGRGWIQFLDGQVQRVDLSKCQAGRSARVEWMQGVEPRIEQNQHRRLEVVCRCQPGCFDPLRDCCYPLRDCCSNVRKASRRNM